MKIWKNYLLSHGQTVFQGSVLEMLLHLLSGSEYRSTRKSKAYIFRIRCNVDVEWGWQWSWGCNGAIERSEPTPIKLFTSFPLIAWDKCKIKKTNTPCHLPSKFSRGHLKQTNKKPCQTFHIFCSHRAETNANKHCAHQYQHWPFSLQTINTYM